MEISQLCVFCGSSSCSDPRFVGVVDQLADLLVSKGIGLVYGGAAVGSMGQLADRVLDQGGRVTGVIPASIQARVGHQGLSETIVVDSMHGRKQRMHELSDGFIALPGGLGTLEELFEALTWQQLGFHNKPCGLLNIDNYYCGLVAQIDQMVIRGFLRPNHKELLLVGSNPGRLLERMEAFEQPRMDKWS